MKQVYYRGAAGSGNGPVARAATLGVPEERVRLAAGLAAYAPPAGWSAGDGGTPPTRLALVQLPDLGRVLLHTAPADDGGYFSHALLDVPPTLDPQQLLQAWGSPDWLRGDDTGRFEPGELFYPPVADALNDAALREFLAQPSRREVAQFLLSATVANPAGRLFVAAPSTDVAFFAYALLRALPGTLTEDFTFSTYEPAPLRAAARLTGTAFGPPADGADLPEDCYGAAGLGINTYTGRSSFVDELPYARFAVDALAEGRTEALDDFRATFQRLGVREPALLDLVYRLTRDAGELSKQESALALQNPALAAFVAGRKDVLSQLLEWALEDLVFATGAFSRAVSALRQKPEALARLATVVQEEGIKAVKGGDAARASNAFEGVLPMVAPPGKAAGVWNEVLSRVADPSVLDWPVRWYLLPRLARQKPLQPGQTPAAPLSAWFRAPAERLGELLDLDLPPAYQEAACLACLEDAGGPEPLAPALAQHSELVLTLMRRLAPQENGEGRAAALFRAVLAQSPGRAWVADLARVGPGLPASLLDLCVDAVLDAGHLDPEATVRERGPALLELLAGRPSLDRLAGLLLLSPPADTLDRQDLLQFLAGLAEQTHLGETTRSRLEGVLELRAYLDNPSLEDERLAGAARSLAVEPPLFPPAALERAVDAADRLMARQGKTPEVQADLESVLLRLGPLYRDGPTGLYRELLRRQGQRKDFWRQPDALHAFLAPALGAGKSAELAGRLDSLEADAHALAFQAARRSGTKVLDAVHARTADWPRPAQAQWNFLTKAVRPRGAAGLARDVLLFVVGAAVGAGVLAALRAAGVV